MIAGDSFGGVDIRFLWTFCVSGRRFHLLNKEKAVMYIMVCVTIHYATANLAQSDLPECYKPNINCGVKEQTDIVVDFVP